MEEGWFCKGKLQVQPVGQSHVFADVLHLIMELQRAALSVVFSAVEADSKVASVNK
jgi:hypothetical protein